MNRMIGAVIALAAVAVACGAQQQGTGHDQVTVAKANAVCPAKVVRGQGLLPDAPSDTLVPPGPTSATACRYANSAEPHPDTLAKSVRLTPAQTAQLVTALNSAKPYPPGAVSNCPNDVGGTDLILFGYSDRGPVDVLVAETGCQSATNGVRATMPPVDAIALLKPLIGA